MYTSSIWAAILLLLGPGTCFRGASEVSTDTYAIVLSASRFWFNYRHTSGALAVYDTFRRLGLPDDRILLYLSEDHAWDSRNPYRGAVFGQDGDRQWDTYPPDVEVDCAGASVTPESFLRAVTGRHSPADPSGCRTTFSPPPSTRGPSTLLLYMTGHGGDGFLKFHDKEELTYADLGHALHDSWLRGLFSRVLVISDTCQAGSLGDWIHSPGVLLVASSVTGQNSYATGRDEEIGLSLSDGFTRVLSDNLRTGWALDAGQQQGQGGMVWAQSQADTGQRAPKGSRPALLHTLCKANSTATRASPRMQDACQYLHRSLSTQDRQGSHSRWPPLHSFYVPVAHALASRGCSGSRRPPWSLPLRTLTMPDWRITSTVTWDTSWAWPLGARDEGARQGEEPQGGGPGVEEEPLLEYWGHAQEVHAHD